MKLTNLCRISNNLFESCIFVDFGGSTSVEYLVSCKNTLTFFAKAPSLMYDKVLNMPLEGFVYDAPRKELVIAPVEKYLTSTAWQT